VEASKFGLNFTDKYMESEFLTFKEVIIELSYNCNISCIMCGFGKIPNPIKKSKFMDFGLYKRLISEVASRTSNVRLNGRGESTIHPQFVEIVEYTKAQFPDLSLSLFSNLSFNSQDIIRAVLEADIQMYVSIDSPNQEEFESIRRGAKFEYVDRNLTALESSKKRPFIVFTIQERNIHRILDIAKYAYERDCHIIYNSVRRDLGIESYKSLVMELLEFIEQQFCAVHDLYYGSGLICSYPDQLAGVPLRVPEPKRTHGTMEICPSLREELVILYDGTVIPCQMFNPYVYGSLLNSSIEAIWKGDKRREFLRSHKESTYCVNCAKMVSDA